MHTKKDCLLCGRRGFLGGLLAAGTAAALGPAARLLASPSPGDRRFVGLFLNGGWDLLLGPDARDPLGRYAGIDVGTELLAPEWREPFPVTLGGREALWGAPMRGVERHADVLTLFNGVNMNTVAHPTGRAYVNTFMPPAGVVPRGDSLGTRMATMATGGDYILPNVSIGVPTRNESYGPEATGIRTRRATEIRDLLRPLNPVFPAELQLTLETLEDRMEPCVGEAYAGANPADELALSRERVRRLVSEDMASEFDFASDERLLARYGITNAFDGNDPGVVAATVHRLLASGLSYSVTAQLQTALDTHDASWATQQPARLAAAFRALAVLLDDLREDDPDLANTTVAVFSEFGRTPRINGTNGRDHWFASSVMVFGGGLRRGLVGGTVPDTLGLRAVDVITGLPSDDGRVLLPEDVGATLAAAAGLDPTPFRVEPLDAWLEGRSA